MTAGNIVPTGNFESVSNFDMFVLYWQGASLNIYEKLLSCHKISDMLVFLFPKSMLIKQDD